MTICDDSSVVQQFGDSLWFSTKNQGPQGISFKPDFILSGSYITLKLLHSPYPGEMDTMTIAKRGRDSFISQYFNLRSSSWGRLGSHRRNPP